MQLVSRRAHAVPVIAIHDKDDTIGVVVVMSPERANLVLPAHIPYCEADVFVLDGLNVEALEKGVRGWGRMALEHVEERARSGGGAGIIAPSSCDLNSPSRYEEHVASLHAIATK